MFFAFILFKNSSIAKFRRTAKIQNSLKIASVALLPRNDESSRIPYRDPPKGLGDDIVRLVQLWNFRIPKKRHPLTPRKSKIPKTKYRIPSNKIQNSQGLLRLYYLRILVSQSLESSKILEFLAIKFRIPRDCFASLAMTKILEFPSFLQPLPQSPKDSTNLKFLDIASLRSQ